MSLLLITTKTCQRHESRACFPILRIAYRALKWQTKLQTAITRACYLACALQSTGIVIPGLQRGRLRNSKVDGVRVGGLHCDRVQQTGKNDDGTSGQKQTQQRHLAVDPVAVDTWHSSGTNTYPSFELRFMLGNNC